MKTAASMAVAAALALLACTVPAGITAATTIDLRSGGEDVQIAGAAGGDNTGREVAFGDIDGDGVEDLVIGSPGSDLGGRSGCGIIYILISSDTLAAAVDLAAARPDLKRIVGASPGDGVGAVLSCGDVNGDQIDDIVCGRPSATVNGKSLAGEVIVIYGSSTFPDTFDLAAPPAQVTSVQGDAASARFGTSVAVGHINDDDYDDVLSGAPLANTPAGAFSGKAVLIYGAASLPAVIDLATAPAGTVTIFGENAIHNFGTACAAGDVNGDPLADLVIGAPQASPLGRSLAGIVYVIPGSGSLPDTIATAGVATGVTRVLGEQASSLLGSVLTTGDVTGDLTGDAVAAAPEFSPIGKAGAGAVYIIPGSGAWPDTVDLALPPAGVGRLEGPAASARVGLSLAAADLNSDNIEDVAIGAPMMTLAGRSRAGAVYVAFGRLLFPPTLDLGMNQPGLTTLLGAYAFDETGSGLAVGRGNADGFADLIVGAEGAAPGSRPSAGTNYVFYGSPGITPVAVLAYDAAFTAGRVRVEWRLRDDVRLESFVVRRAGPGGSVVLPPDRVTRMGQAREGGVRFVLDDAEVTSGARYTYEVALRDGGGHILFEAAVAIPPISEAVLFPAYPNPSSGETTISLRLPQAGPVSVRIYDVRGALVADLGGRQLGEGRSEIVWNGRTRDNQPLPTGIYFVTVEFKGRFLQDKVLILR